VELLLGTACENRVSDPPTWACVYDEGHASDFTDVTCPSIFCGDALFLLCEFFEELIQFMINSPCRLARGLVYGLSLGCMLLPSLGCEQEKPPVIDTSTKAAPEGGITIPKAEQHKLKFQPKN
jgi:hypothetical protein